MSDIFILHENNVWVEPLRAALSELGLSYKEWFLDEGTVPFDRPPPQGVFYNRMSASSHTRGHRYAPELTHLVLNWLECYDRRVLNNSRALYLEISKLAQYSALNRAGIKTPSTVAAIGRDQVLEAARAFGTGPYLLKPNRGGKGLGVQLFQSLDAIASYLDGPSMEAPLDGIWLIQEFIRSPESVIIRCEFVGGHFLYAVRVDTQAGFELCPADECLKEDNLDSNETPQTSRFTIVEAFDDHPIIDKYQRFLQANGIEIAAIEFIQDSSGEIYTYDVNTNTNYNAEAEAKAGVQPTGMGAIARFLGEELAEITLPIRQNEGSFSSLN